MNRALIIFLLSASSACAGAAFEPEAPADARDASFTDPKADGACLEPSSDRAAGVLALVNDPALSVDDLDRPVAQGGAGLYRLAAENIVQSRPFAGLADLDAVPYVGPVTCRALATHACERADLCGPSLKVITWNVENFPLTGDTIDRVAEVVLESQADVIGLQEIADTDAFYDLLDRLPGYAGELAEPGFYTGVGAIFREDRVLPVQVESMFTDDGWSFPRPPLRLQASVADRDISFVVVHLKAQPNSKSEARRRSACVALQEWVADSGQDQVVVLGDWNDQLTDSESSNVFQAFLDEPDRYRFLTQPLADGGAFSYIPFESLIDHILVTDGAAEGWRTVSADVMRLDETTADYLQEVSDHLPIMATLSPR